MNSTFHNHPDFTHAGIIWKHTEIIRKFTRYLKVLNFTIFAQVLITFSQFYTRKNVQNNKIAKLSTCRIWDSLFPHALSKNDTDTLISHISTYSNKIRVSVTHLILITITLINYRKIDIQWDFRFLLLLKSRNQMPVKCFEITRSQNIQGKPNTDTNQICNDILLFARSGLFQNTSTLGLNTLSLVAEMIVTSSRTSKAQIISTFKCLTSKKLTCRTDN